jgi:hypothetical protein
MDMHKSRMPIPFDSLSSQDGREVIELRGSPLAMAFQIKDFQRELTVHTYQLEV